MSYTCFSQTTVQAKKKHRCIWCAQMIFPGESYVRENGVNDGDLQTHPWHPECHEAAGEYFNESGEDEFDPYENERPMTAFDPVI